MSATATPVARTADNPPPPGPARRRPKPLRHRLRRDWQLVVLTVPVLVQLAVFFYTPSAFSVIAFMDYNPYRPLWENPIIGFTHFQILFDDPYFVGALLNTLKFALAQLLFVFPLSIGLALLMHSVVSTMLRSVFQSIVYLPYFFSWVLVVSVFAQMLGSDGLLSYWLMGLGGDRLEIMRDPDTFMFLAWMQWTWKDAGWGMILFLAALASINPALYEAAAVDGANRRKRLWHITLPGIRPVIVLLLILQIGGILSVGFEQYQLQRQAVGWGATEVLDTYVYYRTILASNGESIGTAAGLFKGVIGFILVLFANKAAHRLGEQGIYQKS
ncbi:ABC transporter permease subunit [Glycomyces sp. TRM65418]|uniref:ABC transporter permease n=1 Tax=Glycomyces sp. TRM65418 TaxID=2867006 RepID=UPI001CE4F06A|nr:ABC transporter permease subunit [Glycomyces sp. TRM65418]MCC3764480.1 ABC transporter permease subunit [Glycomyces sp. TRM65418]QZD54153.1 ABC transporter permease subunit [Glycomyces sp. TRM65418]